MIWWEGLGAEDGGPQLSNIKSQIGMPSLRHFVVDAVAQAAAGPCRCKPCAQTCCLGYSSHLTTRSVEGVQRQVRHHLQAVRSLASDWLGVAAGGSSGGDVTHHTAECVRNCFMCASIGMRVMVILHEARGYSDDAEGMRLKL